MTGLDQTSRLVTIRNKRGLHARASAKLVALAAQFDAELWVSKQGVAVSGRSIMGLMMLAAATGTIIEIRATGPDAARAVAAVAQLVEDAFHED